jgi:hypothetical protein
MCEAAMRAVDWVVAMRGIDRCPPAQWTCQLRVTLVPVDEARWR